MQSMTGFGRAEKNTGSYFYTVEAKSVNHRYLDIRFRLPPHLQAFEAQLSEKVRSKIQRGAVEISLRAKLSAEAGPLDSGVRFTIDKGAAESLQNACKQLQAQFPGWEAPTLDAVLATGKVLLPVESAPESPALSPEVLALVEQALDLLVAQRQREGALTVAALKTHIAELK
ncbi:hypothetical protein K2X33_14705, partial [bacterium]|nr:hypothetical protein [bacterium]